MEECGEYANIHVQEVLQHPAMGGQGRGTRFHSTENLEKRAQVYSDHVSQSVCSNTQSCPKSNGKW